MSQEGAFLSSISIDEISIDNVNLEVFATSKPIKKDVRLTLSTNTPDLMIERDCFSATVALSVGFDISNPDGDTIANGNVRGGIKVSVPRAVINGNDPLKLLRINAISILYGHFRTYVTMLCGPTPLKDFYLPTISPAAYIDLVERGEAEEKGSALATK